MTSGDQLSNAVGHAQMPLDANCFVVVYSHLRSSYGEKNG